MKSKYISDPTKTVVYKVNPKKWLEETVEVLRSNTLYLHFRHVWEESLRWKVG